MKLFLVKISAESSRGRIDKAAERVVRKAREINAAAGVGATAETGAAAGAGAAAETGTAADVDVLFTTKQFEHEAEAGHLQGAKLILAVEIDESGINLEAFRLLKYLSTCGKKLAGTTGGIIIDGAGDLYTKDLGRRLAFAANLAGCSFPGKLLVEGTGSLENHNVLAKNWNLDREEAYFRNCEMLTERVLKFSCGRMAAEEKPFVLTVHASNRETSNSLRLWSEVAAHLKDFAHIEEISIQNGQVWDCRGCKYETCVHFGENSSCFYGGVMVEKVYPAILKCDALVLICPNYNDAVSANIMAFINRLTAVFRTNDFSKKRIYAIVVSGYSGGDIVAQQIIGAMNMNKNFILPGGFAMIETANDPGTVMKAEGIEKRAAEFAERILAGFR